jgi:hypothetical protein
MTINTKITISVIIPVFNCEGYVAAAIESVLGQTRSPYEVIVVDDGSSDATATVLALFGSRIMVISQPNRGGADATNRGLRRPAVTYSVSSMPTICGRAQACDTDELALSSSETEAVFGHVRQLSARLEPNVASG